MILLLSIAISICVAAGVWLLLSRDLFRVVIGLSVLGSAVNLIVFIGGRPGNLLPPVIEKGSEVLWKLYEKYPAIQEQFADNKILLLFTSNPYILITTKKQVKTMEDIKGMKIRMSGGPPTEMMKALGGTPMMVPMPDNYMSLQKGVIDGMGAPWEAIHGFRLYEVVNYYTETPFPAVYFSIAMNKKKWDSLDKEIQDAIMSVGGLEGSKFWGRNHFDTAKDGVMEKVKSEGKSIDIYSFSDEERQRWIDTAGKPIWDQWVNKMKEAGHSNAQEILDTAISLSKE